VVLGQMVDVEAAGLGVGEQVQPLGVQLGGLAHAVGINPVEQPDRHRGAAATVHAHLRITGFFRCMGQAVTFG
jgi:putative effector of murein hydrolase